MRLPIIFLFLVLFPFTGFTQSLIEAVKKKDLDLVKEIVSKENIDQVDENGASALMWAVYGGDLNLVRFLHDNRARTDIKGNIYLEDKSYYGNLTGVAAGEGNLEILKFLIEDCGIDINDVEVNPESGKEEGWTALHWAANNGHAAVTIYLLQKHADINFGYQYGERTPLELAIDSGNGDVIDILLEGGADVNIAGGTRKMAPIHYAALNNDTATITKLIKYGADINQKIEGDDWTSMHIAAVQGNEEAYYKLLEFGGDTTILNNEGKTPIPYFNKNRIRVKYNIAQTTFENGDYVKAAELFKDILDNSKFIFENNDTTVIAPSLIYKGYSNQQIRNYDQAEIDYLNALSIYQEINALDHENYSTIIEVLVDLYNTYHEYEKASKLLREDDERVKITFGIHHFEYAMALNRQGTFYLKTQDYSSALEKFLASKMVWDSLELEKESSKFYSVLITNIGNVYSMTGELEKSIQFIQEARSLSKKTFGTDNLAYARILSNLGYLYGQYENYIEAESVYEENKDILERIRRDNSMDYINTIASLATIKVMQGDFEKAKPLYEEALTKAKKLYGENSIIYASILGFYGFMNFTLGDYVTAEKNYTQVVNIYSSFKLTNYELLQTYNYLGLLYNQMDDYENAVLYLEKALVILDDYNLKANILYSLVLGNLGQVYSKLGKINKAEEKYLTALDNIKSFYGENSSGYYINLSNLGLLYIQKKEYQMAEISFLKIINDYKEDTLINLGTNNIGHVYSNLGFLYGNIGEYDKAISSYDTAMDKIKNSFGNNVQYIGYLLNNLSLLSLKNGEYDEGKKYSYEALKVFTKLYGEKTSLYSSIFGTYAYLQELTGNIDSANIYYNKYFSFYKLGVNDVFRYLNSEEKKTKIEELRSNSQLYMSFIFKHYAVLKDNDFYEMELLVKNLEIQTNYLNLYSLLEEKTNSKIIDKWLFSKSLLAKQYALPYAERLQNFDEIRMETEELEEEMNEELKSIGVAYKFGMTTSIEVKNKLNDNETAIEFSSFRYLNGNHWTDSTYYMALVLRKDYDAPMMVKLFEERELAALLPEAAMSSSQEYNLAYHGARGSSVAFFGKENTKGDQLYDLIWKPLDSLMEGVQTVYYANSGLLHRVNLAALPTSDGKLLLEHYQLNQLSSTRNLVLEQEEQAMTDAVIFGGINYDMEAEQMAKAVSYSGADSLALGWLGTSITYPGLRGYEGKFGGFSYLPGSLYEAEKVSKLLESEMSSTLITGDAAVEESFSKLSGRNSPSVIHIATHGFYFPDTITKQTDRDMMLMEAIGEERFRIYDDPLLRSALVMAGANRSWLGEEMPAGVEDGILTAKDVSAMNLSNTELVVLSACQTGLGEVDGSEGVTGLQRGFKMAGVRYIMMSLWPVPDKETAEFMEIFYSHWDEGIQEAFHKTQQIMSNRYRNEPYKWAGFVLVE